MCFAKQHRMWSGIEIDMDSDYRWILGRRYKRLSALGLSLSLFFTSSVWSKSTGIDSQPLYRNNATCQNVAVSHSQNVLQNAPSDMLMTRSDSLTRNATGDFVFDGNVIVSYEDYKFLSNEIAVEKGNRVLRLPSDFTFRSNDVEVQAKNGYYDIDAQNVNFSRVTFQLLQTAGIGNFDEIH